MRRLIWISIVVSGLTSCAKLTPDSDTEAAKKEPASPFGPTGVPQFLRPNDTGTDIMGNPAPAGVMSEAQMGDIMAREEEDNNVLFTDPDNPYGSLPELTKIFEEGGTKGPWELSETIAKRRSMREGKPLLIWFTSSKMSPMDKALSEELFGRHEFGDWAEENMIRLKVDANADSYGERPGLADDEARMDAEARGRDYVERLEKQYKIKGHPSLIVLNPSGEVLNRKRGYKRGDADFLWGVLKQSVVASDRDYKVWRENLEKKGYRDWEGKRGKSIFAKLVSYSKGKLILIEPNGNRSRTDESNLSLKDRAWINAEKRLRGID